MMREALHKSFARPRDWAAFALSALAVFALLVMVPVWTTPGDDVLFRLSITEWDVFVVMAVLSLLNGVLFTMYAQVRRERASHAVAKQAVTGVAVLTSSLFATIGCAACYSSVLAVFGLGGTIFIVEHRWWFAAVAVGLTLFAIYNTARRLERLCTRCTI